MQTRAVPPHEAPGVRYAFRASVGANLVLIAVIGALLLREPVSAPSIVPPPQLATGSGETQNTPTTSHETRAETDEAAPLLPNAVTQLQRAGIPRESIAQALVEDFARRWEQRVLARQRTFPRGELPEQEALELSREREAEQVRELKDALGEEGYRAWDKERTLRLLNTGGVALNAEEADRVYRLQQEFDENHRELQIAMEDGIADPVDATTLQEQARQELDRELESLLGQERFSQLRGAADPIAEATWKFAHLTPTPAQAKAVLEIESNHAAREAALTKRLAESRPDTATLMAEVKAMNDAREENLRRLFGTENYDALQQQIDPTLKTLRQFAATWELKEHEIQPVHETLHAFHQNAERTRAAAQLREAAGQAVNWREINAGIEQAQRQTEAALLNLIGGERLQRLKQNGILATR